MTKLIQRMSNTRPSIFRQLEHFRATASPSDPHHYAVYMPEKVSRLFPPERPNRTRVFERPMVGNSRKCPATIVFPCREGLFEK